VQFKPRKIDDEINEEIAAIEISDNCSMHGSNIWVENANIGISSSDSNLILNNYSTVNTRKPLKIRGGKSVKLRGLDFQRYGNNYY
jgi:hypothetical protein